MSLAVMLNRQGSVHDFFMVGGGATIPNTLPYIVDTFRHVCIYIYISRPPTRLCCMYILNTQQPFLEWIWKMVIHEPQKVGPVGGDSPDEPSLMVHLHPTFFPHPTASTALPKCAEELRETWRKACFVQPKIHRGWFFGVQMGHPTRS